MLRSNQQILTLTTNTEMQVKMVLLILAFGQSRIAYNYSLYFLFSFFFFFSFLAGKITAGGKYVRIQISPIRGMLKPMTEILPLPLSKEDKVSAFHLPCHR